MSSQTHFMRPHVAVAALESISHQEV
uniref:Uncharacterized protein n=1 Tax=Anguilla anguilla TaxID=7936 RepID=A0A0E9R5S0_ANGAN